MQDSRGVAWSLGSLGGAGCGGRHGLRKAWKAWVCGAQSRYLNRGVTSLGHVQGNHLETARRRDLGRVHGQAGLWPLT